MEKMFHCLQYSAHDLWNQKKELYLDGRNAERLVLWRHRRRRHTSQLGTADAIQTSLVASRHTRGGANHRPRRMWRHTPVLSQLLSRPPNWFGVYKPYGMSQYVYGNGDNDRTLLVKVKLVHYRFGKILGLCCFISWEQWK